MGSEFGVSVGFEGYGIRDYDLIAGQSYKSRCMPYLLTGSHGAHVEGCVLFLCFRGKSVTVTDGLFQSEDPCPIVQDRRHNIIIFQSKPSSNFKNYPSICQNLIELP